jgi:anhydro-N-acetylmuramic acid kinase
VSDRLDDVKQLEVDLSIEFSRCAQEIINELNDKPVAIGCHGQTVRHRPELGFTVQLADGAIIAQSTQTPAVVDFRSADVALGGQGAPLVPAFHREFFSSSSEDRAVVNIGGIANVTLLSRDGLVTGFDSGPGNTLMDRWIQLHQNNQWDHNGAWARAGLVDEELLLTLQQNQYFSRKPPKSTGLEYFNLDWLNTFLKGNERPCDVQAVLCVLTAHTVAAAILEFLPEVKKIYLCGGGALNTRLKELIQSKIDRAEVSTTDALGVDPKWVEAIAFAWLARQRINLQTANLPEVTGAARRSILGSVYLP